MLFRSIVDCNSLGARSIETAIACYGAEKIVYGSDGTDFGMDWTNKALAEADVVTLHCPLTPETRHLMDEAAFAALKPGAILVNTARGPIVKQEAVVAALQSGRLMGFGTDVLEVEPATPGNPLFSMPNVIISPHSAASTEEGTARMAEAAARNILAALDGAPDPAMMVNPEILQKR